MDPAHIRIVLLVSALFGTGCAAPCEGAGCGALYPRASLGLFRGDDLAAAEVDALSPSAAVTTTDADGYDWALHGASGGLVVGVPAAGEVRWYDGDALASGGEPTGTLASDGVDDRFGAAVAVGTGPEGARLLVGAPGRGGGPGRPGAGAVLLYEGRGATLSGTVEPRVLIGAEAEDRLGDGVWACGDLDGDGVADWAASAPWSAAGAQALVGSVVLGLSTSSLAEGTSSAADLPRLDGSTSGGRFGATVLCAASLDADPRPELVVAAPYADRVGRDGAGTVSIWTSPVDVATDARPAAILGGNEAGASFGAALAVGDLDGDGVNELAVGAPGVDGSGGDDDATGAVYVYDGAALREKLAGGLDLPTPGSGDTSLRTLRGDFARGRFGSAVSIADLDGDGNGDLVVGAPGANRTGEASSTRAGAATVWWGPHGVWPDVQFTNDASATVVADRQYLETGSVIAATDLEEDGRNELVLLVRVASNLE